MLEALGVSRRYGWRWALKDLDIAVAPGETLAILGKNGSGKSTLLKTLAGLLRPTKGQVRLGGEPLSREARGKIGLLSHEPMLYAGLTIRENLEYSAKLFGMTHPEIAGRMKGLSDALGVLDRLDEPVHVLSQGLRQRVSLARALLHDPEVVLLDEPFSGLDPGAAERLEDVIRTLCARDGSMMVFTTHDVSSAFRLAGRIAVLAAGRLAYDAVPEDAGEDEVLAAFDAVPGSAA